MTDGTAARGIPLRHAARGAGGADASPTHHRAVLPVDRSVLWTPARDPGDPIGPAETGPYDLFLARSVIREIRGDEDAAGREARFGFLLGKLFRCPESGVHYAVADRAVSSAEPMSEDAPDPYLLRAWAEAQPAFRTHGGVLIGWYHTHYLLGLMLSAGDREMNGRYFSEPWQCCVLSVPDPVRPMGAVFRPSATSAEGEAEPASFRELLALEGVPGSGPIPTALRWKNYVADREVAPEPGEVREPPGIETPAIRLPPAEPSASSMTLVLPDNRPQRHYPHLSLRRRTILWLSAVVAVAVGGYLGGLQLFQSGGEPAPTPTPVRQPPLPQEVRRFADAATTLEEATLGYAERWQDFDLGRIGCELLAGGYAAADDAFIAMASAYAGLGALATDSLAAEYERLADDANRVNEHFDSSGCPRPQ